MIKSYKIVLIIQLVLVLIGFFAFKGFYYSDYDQISRALVLLFGCSALVMTAFSVLIQKIIVGVINSDSTTEEVNKQMPNDKFWKNSFLITIILGVLTLIISIVGLCSEIEIGVKNGGFMFNFFVSLLFVTISSLTIGILLRVREAINEITKLLGFLLGLIAVIIFSGCLFLVSSESLWVTSYNRDSLYGTLKNFFEKEEERVLVNEETVTEVPAQVATKGDNEGERENYDYYGFSKMSFPDLETGDYFMELFNESYTKSKVQELFGFFLSDFLSLQKKKSICYLRGSIESGFYSYRYDDLVAVDKMIGRNPESIQKTFDSYSPLIYAFISDETYYDSNLNVIVDILIESHNDLYGTENPEEALNKIHKIMVLGKNTQYPDFHYDKLNKFASKKVLSLIKQNTKDDPDPDYSIKVSAFWVYSFWARRYKENNIDVVFGILQEIKSHYKVDDAQ